MLEADANTDRVRDTQAPKTRGPKADPWTAQEIKKLRLLAPKKCPAKVLIDTFPDRSLRASKKQLSKVREQMGLRTSSAGRTLGRRAHESAMLEPDAPYLHCDYRTTWAKQCARSNAMFVAALGRAGMLVQA